jgi:hypothetical protein
LNDSFCRICQVFLFDLTHTPCKNPPVGELRTSPGKRVGKAWTQTSTGTARNSDLAVLTDLLNPVLPDNVRADDRKAAM